MINSTTQLYGVFGSPVTHSLSPIIHNPAFRDHGVNAVYLAFEPASARAGAEAVRNLNMGGASVTIPFKEEIMAHLDWIHPLAEKIGAVNTVVNEDGQLKGYNTDCKAAVDPLKALGVQGKNVLILGAGGAAKAVAHGIADARGNVFIANRSPEKGRALAQACHGQFVPMEEAQKLRPDMIINTTPIGMDSAPGLSCPLDCLEKKPVVMDAVYTPLNTPLIQAARERGCTVVDGLSMFVAQAAAQFELWTGIEPDLEKTRQWVRDEMEARNSVSKGDR